MPSEGAWPVAETCSALKATRQGCYARGRRPPGARGRRGAELPAKISEVCAAGRGVHGAPKVFAELGRAGVRTPRKRVARLMRENGRAGTARGCARRPKGERKAAAPQADAAPDLVRRDFSADGPDGARFAGITCVRTRQGRPCPAVVMDIRSRMAVGRSMSDRMGAGLAGDALKTAIARGRPGKGRAHRSDHGSRCASPLPGGTMRDAGVEPSMGSISPPWGNAAMESLMGPIKAECAHARTFEAREQASLEIFEYIEAFYNRVRIHSAPGNLSPAELEARHREGAALNAA
ncbi:IS3 family transposase [Enorma massiliensis]|uniref:IS3 family transposase n=1 Tax=Enorma massiliensis TaxID=1472761 RepID=UPI0023F120E5|nr:IS3 family transposase [Enorma massiliensis]